MSNVVKAPENDGFTRILAPASIHPGVCVDVVDRGMKDTGFGMKLRKSIHFLIDENIPTGTWTHPHTGEVVEVHEKLAGKPFMVSASFNATLGEGSHLRKFLRTWRGEDFTREELQGFELDSVIGVPCALTIVHNENDGKWYANNEGITALPEGWTRMTVPQDYVRIEDREPRDSEQSQQPATQDAATPEPSGTAMTGPAPNFPEDDLPFSGGA